jgi:putative intracellular protease/amidase
MATPKKVHIVLSSFGFWGEELVAPMEEFDKAGIAYDFSTPYGHPPEVVPVSMDPDYVDPPLKSKVTSPEMAAKVRKIVESALLKTVKKVNEANVSDYDALLLVGGSGPILDMNNCRALHSLILQFVKANKLVAAECYSIGALAFTRDPDNNLRSIIWGKKVTGHPIPFDYTTEYGYAEVTSKYPFIGPPIPLEYLLKDAVGPEGEFIANLDKEISVVMDLPFITSRSVAESRECGRAMVRHLMG